MEQVPVIREYGRGDKEGVFALKEAVDGSSFDEQLWNWKFGSGAIRAAKLYVAESRGMIVGLRAFIIEELKVIDELWLSGLGVDTMVHPDFRRCGIAATMAQEGFRRMGEEGMPILLSFPNDVAFKVYSRKRPYWRHICSVPLLAKPLNVDNILRGYIRNPFLRRLTNLPVKAALKVLSRSKLSKSEDLLLRKVDVFDSQFDNFWERASKQYDIGVVRDRKFLNWRFVDKPGDGYSIFSAERGEEIQGYIVLKNAEMFGLRLGLIVDILTVGEDSIADSLLAEAIDYFTEMKIEVIGCLMLKHAPYFRALRKAGFISVPKMLVRKE